LTRVQADHIINHMVNYDRQLDSAFGALSDPTRRAILARLATGETRVGELAALFKVSWPAVTKHVRVLQKAGLLVQRRDGRERRCRLRAEAMREPAEWIDRYRTFWTGKLEGLAEFFDDQGGESNSKPRRGKTEKKA